MRHLLIVFFISGLTGITLSRCKSIPIQEKEAKQIAAIDDVETDIEASNLTPEKKARAKQVLTGAKDMIREQGQTITVQDQKIETGNKYKHIVWVGGAILGLSILGALYLRFKP